MLEAAAERLADCWMYPETAYGELVEAVAGRLGVAGQVLPGHGIQALVMTIVSAFVSPGDRVVVPRPTYGLYAPACQAAGADVRRVDCPELRLDLERIAAEARETDARLVWICDPNNPTGARLDPAEWSAFLDALPGGCTAVADEAYVDYIRPRDRTPRLGDVAAGRRVIVLRTFSKVFALAGLGWATRSWTELATYLHSVQEPFNVNVAALAAGIASLERPEQVDARREETITCPRAARQRVRASGLEPARPRRTRTSSSSRLPVADDLAADRPRRSGAACWCGREPSSGCPDHVRVTVAPAPLMEAAAAELADACIATT